MGLSANLVLIGTNLKIEWLAHLHHVRLPEASFPDLGPSRGPLCTRLALLEDRVRPEALGLGAGAGAGGVRGALRCGYSCAPKTLLRLEAPTGARGGSQQLGHFSYC